MGFENNFFFVYGLNFKFSGVGALTPSAPFNHKDTPPHFVCEASFLLQCDDKSNQKGYIMYEIKSSVKWMTDNEINKLASELVSEFADGTANEQLAELLTSFREGKKINGKQVYIRNLLGAIKSMCPELLNDVMSLSDSTSQKKYKYRK